MKLPEPRDDRDWSRLRQHDLEELWEHATNPHVAASYAARISLLLDRVGACAGPRERVLDVGGAQGTLGLLLAERRFEASLLDVRDTNIEYARARYERGTVSFHVELLAESALPDEHYDVVVCTEVLEHVREPARLITSLRLEGSCWGSALSDHPERRLLVRPLADLRTATQETIDQAEANSLDGDAHRYLFTKEELTALVRGVGLRVEEHGFFLPAWLEGHVKTRYAHQALFRLRGEITRMSPTIPWPAHALSRRLCASQWIIARRP